MSIEHNIRQDELDTSVTLSGGEGSSGGGDDTTPTGEVEPSDASGEGGGGGDSTGSSDDHDSALLQMNIESAMTNGATLLIDLRARYMDGMLAEDEAIRLGVAQIMGWFKGPDAAANVQQCIAMLPVWLFGREPEPTTETVVVVANVPPTPPPAIVDPSEEAAREDYINALVEDGKQPMLGVDSNGRPKLGRPFIDDTNDPSKKQETWYRNYLAAMTTDELRHKAEVVSRERTHFHINRLDDATRKFLADTILRESLRVQEGLLSVTADVWDQVIGKIFESVGYEHATAFLNKANYARRSLGMSRALETYSRVIKELAALAGLRVLVGTETNARGLEVGRYTVVSPDEDYTFDEMLRISVALHAHYSSLRRTATEQTERTSKLSRDLDRNIEELTRTRSLLKKREEEVTDLTNKAGTIERYPLAYMPDQDAQFVIRHVDMPNRYIGLTQAGKDLKAARKEPRIYDYVPVKGIGKALKLNDLVECRTIIDMLMQTPFYRRVNITGEDGSMHYGIFRLVMQDYGS